MMRSIFALILMCTTMITCSDKKQKIAVNTKDESVHAPYDTIAIDSFSSGATSVDIVAQIRRSSIAYQDSLKSIAAAAEEAKKKTELEKLKKEAEKKELAKKEEQKKKENPVKEDASPSNQNPTPETPKN